MSERYILYLYLSNIHVNVNVMMQDNILKRHDNGHTSGHIYSEGRNDLDSALSGKDVRLPF
jgi:hypothetical protein